MRPAKHAEELAKWVDGVVVEIFPGCSHYLHHDKTDLFVAKLREFLDQPNVARALLRAEPPERP